MHYSPRILRIAGASLVAILLVGGSYAVSGPGGWLGLIKTADAQSSQELLKAYAAKDTDSDGLPDWQEALYGTDPANPHSFKADLTDGEAVSKGLIEPKVRVATTTPTDISSIPGTPVAPSTLTDQFAQTLLTQYLSTRGNTPPTADQIAAFVQNGVANLSQQSASPDTFAMSDVKVSGATGPAALSQYAADAQTAFAKNTVTTNDSALNYFSAAMDGDKTAFKSLQQVGKAYKDIANGLMQVSVPKEAAPGHLAIANALMHLSEVSADMGSINTDPLRALMGIGLYDPYSKDLTAGFFKLGSVFDAEQVVIPEDQTGHDLYVTMGLAKQATKAAAGTK